MALEDLFNSIPTKTVSEVRSIIDKKVRDEYTILDVRQPQEYEKAHIPGSVLIPLGELMDRANELDSENTTLVYCRSGSRSLSATGLLIGMKFKDVYTMEGGINAWNGLKATGQPEIRMLVFPQGASLSELIAIAYSMEEGSKRFYSGVRDLISETKGKDIFAELIKAEDKHKESIVRFYGEVLNKALSFDEFEQLVATELNIKSGSIMESGLSVDDTLLWARGHSLSDILDISMSFEANSYEVYLLMAQKAQNDINRSFFMNIANEELSHLRKMATLIDSQ
ncbi:MAG: hypothetical protein L3V56_10105 [Candidatus Magnetoovum sp. WYHC-5]|nr:hypothetical protein [Candidatus Magnetoovum sp. WYHC-5]